MSKTFIHPTNWATLGSREEAVWNTHTQTESK